jgi:hypothetical protein
VEPLLVLTIGQALRDGIGKELRQVLGALPIEVRGALDGFFPAPKQLAIFNIFLMST